jgi:integrase
VGRQPTVNSNLPPNMRKRVRKYGTYYYLDDGTKKEIALGSDYIIALQKYAELCISATITSGTFGDAIDRYALEELPKLKPNSQKIFKSDIKHVKAFFASAPINEVKPKHIRQFLDEHKAIPTTANRCKRVFSVIWNHARGWGYTDLPNPCEGIEGHPLQKRMMYITDDMYAAVYKHAVQPLKDAMDLAYLTGQRPADALGMTEFDLVNDVLIVTQDKTQKPLRIVVSGNLKELIERIHARKDTHKIVTGALLVNTQGRRLTAPMLRNYFDDARKAAITENPEIEKYIKQFQFRDLRAKAADDVSDSRSEQEASDLLGHDNVKTTQKHYLRRGRTVSPTK